MAKTTNSPSKGSDAAYITPRLIPDFQLQGRDDSGGPEYQEYTASFGDGGFVMGDKAHLSAHGGSDDAMNDDEIGDDLRAVPAEKALKQTNVDSPKPPSKSIKMQRK